MNTEIGRRIWSLFTRRRSLWPTWLVNHMSGTTAPTRNGSKGKLDPLPRCIGAHVHMLHLPGRAWSRHFFHSLQELPGRPNTNQILHSWSTLSNACRAYCLTPSQPRDNSILFCVWTCLRVRGELLLVRWTPGLANRPKNEGYHRRENVENFMLRNRRVTFDVFSLR